jgi:hypothetical protein
MTPPRIKTVNDFQETWTEYRRLVFSNSRSSVSEEEMNRALVDAGRIMEPMIRRIRSYAVPALKLAVTESATALIGAPWPKFWDYVFWDHCERAWRGEHFAGDANWLTLVSESRMIEIHIMALDAGVWFHNPQENDRLSDVQPIPLADWVKKARTRLGTGPG